MFTGNVIASVGDVWQGREQGIILNNGRLRVPLVGLATLTSTLQTLIPVMIYPPFNKEMTNQYPPVQMQVPVGGQVVAASFRLPANRVQGYQYEWGRQVPDGCTIIGTSGDVLKVSTGANNATTAANTASLVSANNAYAPGSTATIARAQATADVSGGLLNTVSGSPWLIALAIDNTGNSAAGTGIRLSLGGATAVVAVQVIYEINDNAIRFEDVLLGGAGRGFYTR